MADPVISPPQEERKPVVGYEDRYLVSDMGRVFSIRSRRCLEPSRNVYGYFVVGLSGCGAVKMAPVHRLVSAAFIGPRPIGQMIAHGNAVRTDNRLTNLRYASPFENSQDRIRHGNSLKGETSPTSKLTDEQVLEIRKVMSEKRRNAKDGVACSLGAKYGISSSLVYQIHRRDVWQHI
jgi:hypothetical protein